MSRLVYLNGDLVPQEEAKVSVFDHGLLYGDGVFEGIRAYGRRAFKLAEHVSRLYRSAHAIKLEIPLTPAQMVAAVERTLAANTLSEGYIRVVVTRGVGTLGLDPDKCSHPQVIIIADSIVLYPEQFYRQGLAIVTVRTIRNHPAALDPRIKSLNYLNNILAKIEGKNAGVVEALMLNAEGLVAECTGDNIFIVTGGVLRTPAIGAGLLEGITRDTVIDLAREAGTPVREENLTLYDVYNADECFLTGTAAEVIAVVTVDGRTIGTGEPGPVTKDLLERFRALTRGS
jgi:branched-chain amino acid aminotransferase